MTVSSQSNMVLLGLMYLARRNILITKYFTKVEGFNFSKFS